MKTPQDKIDVEFLLGMELFQIGLCAHLLNTETHMVEIAVKDSKLLYLHHAVGGGAPGKVWCLHITRQTKALFTQARNLIFLSIILNTILRKLQNTILEY